MTPGSALFDYTCTKNQGTPLKSCALDNFLHQWRGDHWNLKFNYKKVCNTDGRKYGYLDEVQRSFCKSACFDVARWGWIFSFGAEWSCDMHDWRKTREIQPLAGQKLSELCHRVISKYLLPFYTQKIEYDGVDLKGIMSLKIREWICWKCVSAPQFSSLSFHTEVIVRCFIISRQLKATKKSKSNFHFWKCNSMNSYYDEDATISRGQNIVLSRLYSWCSHHPEIGRPWHVNCHLACQSRSLPPFNGHNMWHRQRQIATAGQDNLRHEV